jgi:hypothetical protein
MNYTLKMLQLIKIQQFLGGKSMPTVVLSKWSYIKGSMLWSLFSATFATFRRQKWLFFLTTNVAIIFFFQKSSNSIKTDNFLTKNILIKSLHCLKGPRHQHGRRHSTPSSGRSRQPRHRSHGEPRLMTFTFFDTEIHRTHFTTYSAQCLYNLN